MLGLENIAVSQGSFRISADFSVGKGERVAVIGPSGAGKSTLLSAVAGFLTPDKGRITWEGSDLAKTEPGDRPVSILFQDNNLFPHLTAEQNVGLGIRPSLRLSEEEKKAVSDALYHVGIASVLRRYPGELSGGQQSRVALARILLLRQPILLLDEPFAALGPALRAEMLELVKDIASDHELTVLMVTHESRDAERLGGGAVFCDAGVAHSPVDVDKLFAAPPQALRAYLE